MTFFRSFASFCTVFILSCNFFVSAQTPCENGMAGEYPCQNIKLLGHLTADELLADIHDGIRLNDIWGWTDPTTSKEYAVIGMANGTSFVDVTDPVHPVMLGILPEHHEANSSQAGSRVMHDGGKSVWRDVKIYANHAFIVSEDQGHGMQIFDLTQLRDVVEMPATFGESGHYDGISNAHNIVINEASGFAYAVGAKGGGICSGGGLHAINIQNPTSPVYAGCFDSDGYTHDAQCVTYQGPDSKYFGREICVNSNENSVTIVDVDDKSDMKLISKVSYVGVQYTHQGWFTEDHKYFITNDELDELYDVVDHTRTFIWDVQNLEQPSLIGTYDHSTGSIDHNLYIVGDHVFESNYTSGLRILDITKVSEGSMQEIGFFDTFPKNEAVTFDGTWSNYPFFASGTIAVSDITNGLFLLQLDLKDSYIVKQPQPIKVCEGEATSLSVEIFGQPLSYQWQYDQGDGFVDIQDLVNYENTNSNVLHINPTSSDQLETLFRCKITLASEELISDEVFLLIKPLPVPDFDMSITKNSVTFINQSIHANEYLWEFGDVSANSVLESPTHTYPLNSDVYQVKLHAINDCSTQVQEKSLNLTISNAGAIVGDKIVVYPNPGQNFIGINNQENATLSYRIYDTSGRTILSGTSSGRDDSIFVGHLYPGIYMMEITGERGLHISQKIVIEN